VAAVLLKLWYRSAIYKSLLIALDAEKNQK
jgi:hypothetical protein